MRSLALIPLALLASGCWKPGPGEIDPTRYPWNQKPQPQPQPEAQPAPEPQPAPAPTPVAEAEAPPPPPAEPDSYYCVVPLEPTAQSGIIISGGAERHSDCGPNASSGIQVGSEGSTETKPGEITASSAWNTGAPSK